jgi:hypothetical protein
MRSSVPLKLALQLDAEHGLVEATGALQVGGG